MDASVSLARLLCAHLGSCITLYSYEVVCSEMINYMRLRCVFTKHFIHQKVLHMHVDLADDTFCFVFFQEFYYT